MIMDYGYGKKSNNDSVKEYIKKHNPFVTTESLRDFARMINIDKNYDEIAYEVCNGKIVVEFKSINDSKYDRVFACFESDGMVSFYGYIDGDQFYLGYVDDHSWMGSNSYVKFAEALKEHTGACIRP